jgi:oligopeptide/dipeptide ABC transporter ATP-binding protein
MRQRVLIALSIVANPDLLIADEATTALDVTVQRAVLDLIVRLTEELNASLILVSHDLDVVRTVTHNVVIMYAGRTIEVGPTEQVLHAPEHPYTQALVAARPSAVAPGQLLASIPGSPPGLSDVLPGCAFAARCRVVTDICTLSVPPLTPLTADHAAACVHVGTSREPVT